MLILLSFILFGIFSVFSARWVLPIPPKNGLRILMYHAISLDKSDGLTVTLTQLEEQFLYLKNNGYTPVFFQDFGSLSTSELPSKPVIITFDDAYQNNADYLFPLLEKHQIKACIALPLGFLGQSSLWDGEKAQPIMSVETLSQAPKTLVEYSFHGFSHINYRNTSLDLIEADVKQAKLFAKDHNLDIQPVIMYPYGGFPREKKQYSAFCKMLVNCGIQIGCRIGNRVNPLPLKDPFHVCRIDIKGTDSFKDFQKKLHNGRKFAF